MRNNREQRLRQNPGLLLLLAAAVVIMLYAFLAYPIYTRMKMQVLKNAYKEISVMNLAMLDEEETSILQSFNADKLEFLITDENFALVYTNKSQAVDQQIERYVRSRADEFQEEPTLTAREYNSFCVIRLRALLHADGKTYSGWSLQLIKNLLQTTGALENSMHKSAAFPHTNSMTNIDTDEWQWRKIYESYRNCPQD